MQVDLLAVIWLKDCVKKDTGKRCRSKYPEFSKTEANEFVCGDLRDVEIVRRVIRFGGYRGNYYSQIVDKFRTI